MGNDDWLGIALFFWAMILMYRLDRLGRQLEAVSETLKAEIVGITDGGVAKRELVSKWRANYDDKQKASRRFWWTAVFIGIGAVWLVVVLSHK